MTHENIEDILRDAKGKLVSFFAASGKKVLSLYFNSKVEIIESTTACVHFRDGKYNSYVYPNLISYIETKQEDITIDYDGEIDID